MSEFNPLRVVAHKDDGSLEVSGKAQTFCGCYAYDVPVSVPLRQLVLLQEKVVANPDLDTSIVEIEARNKNDANYSTIVRCNYEPNLTSEMAAYNFGVKYLAKPVSVVVSPTPSAPVPTPTPPEGCIAPPMTDVESKINGLAPDYRVGKRPGNNGVRPTYYT